MHEMSLAEGVLQVIEDAARQQGFTRVKAVWLEVGQLACVQADALAFSLEQVTRGSIADSARLEIVEIKGRGRCADCGHDVPLAALHEPCPDCGNYRVAVTDGDQLRVRELEVEYKEQTCAARADAVAATRG
jgi:hydrogenase nickel incorporation protein HypA/HybF